MHILLIHQFFQERDDPGGLRWNAMAQHWAAKGHKITVIAGMTHYTKGVHHPKYAGRFTLVEDFDTNIRVIRTHVSESYNENFRGRLRAYFSFVWSGTYGGLFKAREKYDLILVSSPPLTVGIIALILSFFKRIPFVLEVRDLWPESAIDTGVLTNKWMIRQAFRLESLLYRKAKKINVVTPAMRQTLTEKKNVSPEKLICIPNAADMDITEQMIRDTDIVQLKSSLGIENAFSVCYVGAHGVANHLEQVIEAACLLRGEDVIFLLIGDGMQKQNLIQQAAKHQLGNIRFMDAVSKETALRYILACDAGLSVLKKADTFKTVYSNKTFDYMACGKPVLMAIDGISRSLIEQANAGTFVEPENAEALANTILLYKKDAELCRVHGKNGQEYVRSHFDRRQLADDYLNEISRLHSSKGENHASKTQTRHIS